MPQITPFTFDSQQIRVVMDEQGVPWFNANDVCEVLGYANSRKAIDDHVDPDDVTKRDAIDNLNRSQPTNHLNEFGVYALIFGSTKPEAKRFKRWVTSEVLPAIRKTGSYSRGSVKGSTPTGRPANRVEDLLNRIDEDVFFGLFREK